MHLIDDVGNGFLELAALLGKETNPEIGHTMGQDDLFSVIGPSQHLVF